MAEENNGVKASESRNLISEMYVGTAEKTYLESGYVAKSLLAPYNSDDLWQKAGDYSIYEDMSNDDQIASIVQLKIDMILGSGWTIAVDNDDQQEMADQVYKYLCEDSEQSLDVALEDIIRTSLVNGFSIAEKVFKINDDNKLVWKCLKNRYPNSWLIHTDKKGNIVKYEQQGVSGNLEIEKESLFHLVNKRQYDNPYGQSDLRQAYKPWFAKNQIIKYYAIFLEKYASPIPHAKYKDGLSEEKQQELLEHLKRFQQKTAVVHPESVEIDFLNSSGDGSSYEKAINLFNILIARSMLLPDLAGMSGSQSSGGSYSLGEIQINNFVKHIEKKRRVLEHLINKHIIEPLVVWNFGEVDFYPKFKFNSISEENTSDFAKIFIEAIKGNVYKPSEEEINHFRSLIKFPEGDVEFYQPPINPLNGVKPLNEVESDTGEEKEKEGEEVEASEIEKEKEPAQKEYAYKQTPGDYSKKVDFKIIKNQLLNNEDELRADLLPVIEEQFEDLYNQIERKKILGQNPKPEKIDSLDLKNLKKMELILKKHFKDLFSIAQKQAATELIKGNYTSPYPSEEFLSLLNTEIFKYIGDYKYQVLNLTKNEIIKVIKDGRPLSSLINVLDDKGKKLSEVSLERFARTKTTEVYNQGRKAFFDDTGFVSAYQYSAILDDATTEVCRGLHGKIFNAASDFVPTPPLHFNCRSLLIPITKFEEYKVSESVGDTPIEEWTKDKLDTTGFSVFSLDDN